MTLKYLPQIFADKSADKIADLVFQSFTSIEIKTIWYNFVEPYLRIYLRLICGNLREINTQYFYLADKTELIPYFRISNYQWSFSLN